MAFVKLPGAIGKLYIPETRTEQAPKHPCPDCFSCQWCTDERCRVCRLKDCPRKDNKRKQGRN